MLPLQPLRQGGAPAVTVVALCYNHARFLQACLDSIRAQSFQDFQLIVTDDASRDDSPVLIAEWLALHRPDATFIRHEANQGICATLNEALSHARGEYIAMIATDDTWEPDRLAQQLAAMRKQPDNVALVYSDAHCMDEAGQLLEGSFLTRHGHGAAPPTGAVFAALANGNFIPAMAALVRRGALRSVGGYDETLTYEDYDMWLRLAAAGWLFTFVPGCVARYRIVSTSMVRTLFVQPTAAHSRTALTIRRRWLNSGLLSAQQRRRWSEDITAAAYNLYVHGDAGASRALWLAARLTRRPRMVVLALAASLGLSRHRVKKLSSLLGGAS